MDEARSLYVLSTSPRVQPGSRPHHRERHARPAPGASLTPPA